MAVYRSVRGALTAWSVGQGITLDNLASRHFEAYIHTRSSVDELTPRHAWRLFTLADAVMAHPAGITEASAQHVGA